MKRQLDLSLILPCYNEEAVFTESVAEITRVLSLSRLSYEIIFVDDKSRDRTPELIEKIIKKYPHCRAIYHQANRGRGRTVSDGIKIARGVVVGYIDIDLEVSPVYIPSIVDLIIKRHADMVIGKRIYRSGPESWLREVLSLGYQQLVSKLLNTGGLDTESGYKFFRRSSILPILAKVEHPHWFWDTEVTVFARRFNLKIIEISVLFIRRFDKVSSVRIIPDTIDYLVNIWRLRRRTQTLRLTCVF